MSNQNTMKAIFSTKESRTLVDRPIPTPDADEVLIKNVVVSSNPKDWKVVKVFFSDYNAVEGNDVAGTIEAVGSNVKDFKKGDKVAALSKLITDDKYGAYAEYTVSPAHTAFQLGPNTKYEDAATLPLAYMTAALGLFAPDRLNLPEIDSETVTKGQERESVLIWGASSTVGVFAVQLAKKANLHVVGIAGGSSALAKSYGADDLIDYRGKSRSEMVEAIRTAAGGKIRYAYDAISENGTTETIIEAFKENGGKITHTLPLDDSISSSLPSNISLSFTSVGSAHENDAAFAKKYFELAGKWLESGEFRGMKVTVVDGGLEGVDEGLNRLEQNKTSGEKLVYRVADTPALKK